MIIISHRLGEITLRVILTLLGRRLYGVTPGLGTEVRARGLEMVMARRGQNVGLAEWGRAKVRTKTGFGKRQREQEQE